MCVNSADKGISTGLEKRRPKKGVSAPISSWVYKIVTAMFDRLNGRMAWRRDAKPDRLRGLSTPRRCPRVLGVWRGADHLLSLRASTAMLVVFIAPRLVFGLICAALILHLRPEAPGSEP